MRHHLTARNSVFSTFSGGGGPATARLTAFQTAVLCVVKNYLEIKETNRVAKIFVLLFRNLLVLLVVFGFVVVIVVVPDVRPICG